MFKSAKIMGMPSFNNAKNLASFVDSHVSYIKMYWNTNQFRQNGVLARIESLDILPGASPILLDSGREFSID
jgi:hypothetical protein